jgi:hypothetical protein
MNIRAKMILIVLPLIAGPLVTTGYLASLTARNGITRVVTSLLQFKEEELLSYASGQWSLLVDNGLAGNPTFLDATKAAVEAFARNMIRSDTELILAVDAEAEVAMGTAPLALSSEEKAALAALIAEGSLGWRPLRLGGSARSRPSSPSSGGSWSRSGATPSTPPSTTCTGRRASSLPYPSPRRSPSSSPSPSS